MELKTPLSGRYQTQDTRFHLFKFFWKTIELERRISGCQRLEGGEGVKYI
jgi:hypothetical protein